MGLWLGLSIYELICKFTMLFKIFIFEFIRAQNFEFVQAIFRSLEFYLKFSIILMIILNLKLLFTDFYFRTEKN